MGVPARVVREVPEATCSDRFVCHRCGMEQIDGRNVDLTRLPPDLQELAPLVREWAVGDEEERDRRLESASTEELASLWLAVSPHLPAINAYLEAAVQGPDTDEAIVLAATADTALEAEQVVERRTGQTPS